jgi:hypothetical protein
MTDYFSNIQIIEAYQKMYEAANTDGTIDDRSRYEVVAKHSTRVFLERLYPMMRYNIFDAIDDFIDGKSDKVSLLTHAPEGEVVIQLHSRLSAAV